MNLMRFQFGFLIVAATFFTGVSAKAQAADKAGEASKLQWRDWGIVNMLDDNIFWHVVTWDDKGVPPLLKSKPKGLVSPHYGKLTVGTGDKARPIYLIADIPDGAAPTLYVNTSGDGDMANDPGRSFRERTFQHFAWKDVERHFGVTDVSISIPFPDGSHSGNLIFGRPRSDLMLFTFDFGYTGTTMIDGKPIVTVLQGDYENDAITGALNADPNAGDTARIWFDLNGDEKVDQNEMVEGNKPFEFDGKQWSIDTLKGDGIIHVGEYHAPPAAVPAGVGTGVAAINKPLDLKFTAVDGTKIDLQAMHGKVVLIDFWATWCSPCRASVPELRRVYHDLHSRGFEIIGIALDENKEDLLKVTKSESMTWPQFFDGKGWDNEIAKRFGIDSVPRTWLVDKNGILVDTDGRDDLRESVEKLLKEETKADQQPSTQPAH